MRGWFVGAALALAAVASPVCAQTAPAAAPAPDPARLAAAQALLARFMPPERRDAMVEQMIRPMVDNMREAMASDPQFESLRKKDPKLGPVFDEFIAGEFDQSIAATKAVMPAMLDAMARAYARRFSLEQLQAIAGFFDTPAGRAFAEQAPGVMADPDVLAVQRKMMTEALAGMQQRVEAFATKAAEAGQKKE